MQFHPQASGLFLSPVRAAAGVLGAAILIAVAAKVQVPFWPVPMTLHTLAVLSLAVLMGPRQGFAAMSAYLVAGLAGLTVFSGAPERGVGLAYVMGPTGGYLLGYLAAACVTGRLAQGRGLIGTGAAMLAGLAVVYAAGLTWLSAFVPGSQLIAAGFAPFILGDLIKAGVALALIAALRRVRAAS